MVMIHKQMHVSMPGQERYFNNEAIGIVEASMDHTLVRVNPKFCEMLEYTEAELLSQKLADITHPDDRSITFEKFDRAIHETHASYTLEKRYVTKSGRAVPVALSVQPTDFDDAGNPTRLIAFVVDLSRVHDAEERFTKASARVEEMMSAVGKSLSHAIEARDPYTAGHQDNVAKFAAEICQELGWGADFQTAVVSASLVHDIGKIGVPVEYLTKVGKLTSLEFDVIKTHAQTGYEILRDIQTEYPLAEIVYQHHERADGSGYPRGLMNGSIMKESCIIAVADSVDAIVNPRPYRKALGRAKAASVLKDSRGTAFDAEIVDAAIEILDRREGMFHTA